MGLPLLTSIAFFPASLSLATFEFSSLHMKKEKFWKLRSLNYTCSHLFLSRHSIESKLNPKCSSCSLEPLCVLLLLLLRLVKKYHENSVNEEVPKYCKLRTNCVCQIKHPLVLGVYFSKQ